MPDAPNYQPTLVPSRPDDWEDWPRSARREFFRQHRTGKDLVAELAEQIGVDPGDLEWPRSSTRQAVLELLLEVEADDADAP